MTTTDLLNPYTYPWMAVSYFLCLWFLSHCIRYALEESSSRLWRIIVPSRVACNYNDLDEEKKRNCITYIAQIIVTTFALVAQLYGGSHVVFQWSDSTDQSKLEWMSLSLQLIAILYVWEMIYRLRFDWPLLVHHLVTLMLVQTSILSYYETGRMYYIRGGTLLGFHATTEQLSFLCLFAYRTKALNNKTLSYLFYTASIQTFVFKTLATGGTLYIFANNIHHGRFETNWGLFWKIVYIPLLLALIGSQIYACKVLYHLGSKVGRVRAATAALPGSAAIKEPTTTSSDDIEDDGQHDHEDVHFQSGSDGIISLENYSIEV